MNFIDITTDNIKSFWPSAEKRIIDDIACGRFLAIGAEDEKSAKGLIVYTVRSTEDAEGNTGVLYYLSGDETTVKALLDEYKRRCYRFTIRRTLVEISDKKVADILEDYGFDMEEGESIDLVLSMKDLKSITPFQELEIPDVICPLSSVSPIEFRCFLQEYSQTEEEGPLYDIESTPMDWYDTDVSSVSVNDEGIDGAFLVRFDGENTIVTELLAGFGDKFAKKIPYLLACSATNAIYTHTSDIRIIIRRRNKTVAKITDKILSGMKGQKAYHGILME